MTSTSPANDNGGTAGPRWLADFCSVPVLFGVMVVAELVVLVILIAPSDETQPLVTKLATTSLFVQWLALLCAVCLCQMRKLLESLPVPAGVVLAYLLMLSVSALGSWIVFAIDHQLDLELTLPARFEMRFVLRNALLCALVGTALLRYFYLLEQWRSRVRAEARTKFEALQARIRPHFLFNSMNTIASLIPTRPADAERTVMDLSDLFRAALGRSGAQDTLGDEIDLVRRYLAIEQHRLGERLRVEIDVAGLPGDLALPTLLLQPLVENAVYHGIEPLAHGGTVAIVGRRSGGAVEITIRNPRPPPGARTPPRNGMALANTRSRIEYHFGRHGALTVREGDENFEVVVRLPVQQDAPQDTPAALRRRRRAERNR
ncbi:MAG TPA: sensor histidine kinase [Rudaea sp.]